MAHLVKTNSVYNTSVKEFYCDTTQDFETYLKEDSSIPIGSKVYIIVEETTMEKGTDGWVELSSSGGGSSSYTWAHSQEGF